MKIKARKIVEGLADIYQAHPGEWYDLRCAEDVEMHKGEFKVLHLGVAIEIPEGYEAICVPRSSTFKNYGIILANSIGVIDQKYCGDNDEWRFPAIALRDTKILKNDRIAQFRLLYHNPEAEIEYVEHLNNEDRGGLGSSGSR